MRFRRTGAWVAVSALIATAAAAGVIGGSSGASTCTGTSVSPGSLSTAITSAASGSTLCLNAGTYTWTAGAYGKASTITVKAANGVARDSVVVNQPYMWDTHKLAFENVQIKGALLGGDGDAPVSDLSFKNIHWTGCMVLRQISGTQNITFDGGIADVTQQTGGATNASPCLDDGRFYLRGYQGPYPTNNNITIKNIDFPGANCTDGIEAVGYAEGYTVGPGNTFHGIQQGSCTTHVDPVQFYGSRYGKIVGNYFYNNTDGILSSNGNGDNSTIVDNVFGPNGDAYPYAVVDCGGDGQLYQHNLFLDDALYLCNADVGDIGPTTTTVVKDNYMPGGFLWNGETACTGVTSDYNMHPTTTSGLCGGAHNFVGTAAFAGGATPSSWLGYLLAAGSPGITGASDGLAIGPRASAGS